MSDAPTATLAGLCRAPYEGPMKALAGLPCILPKDHDGEHDFDPDEAIRRLESYDIGARLAELQPFEDAPIHRRDLKAVRLGDPWRDDRDLVAADDLRPHWAEYPLRRVKRILDDRIAELLRRLAPACVEAQEIRHYIDEARYAIRALAAEFGADWPRDKPT